MFSGYRLFISLLQQDVAAELTWMHLRVLINKQTILSAQLPSC